MARSTGEFYKPERIQNVNGKLRCLDVPRHSMRVVLKRLHALIQDQVWFSACAHGGVRGRSTFSSAEKHLRRFVVEKRDISNCYPSITREMLYKSLMVRGFRSDTAALLASLMTVVDSTRNRIPQGASTSGDALNLFLWVMDDAVQAQCHEDVNFSRYADDFVVSGDNVNAVRTIANFVESELKALGLRICEKKRGKEGTATRSQKQVVHGISVNHFQTRIPKDAFAKFISLGLAYVNAARRVTAESLPALARKRAAIMGCATYSQQAQDASQSDHLRMLVAQGDLLVQGKLVRLGVSRKKKWWVSNGQIDRPAEIASQWRKVSRKKETSTSRRRFKGMVTPEAGG